MASIAYSDAHEVKADRLIGLEPGEVVLAVHFDKMQSLRQAVPEGKVGRVFDQCRFAVTRHPLCVLTDYAPRQHTLLHLDEQRGMSLRADSR